jgi:hypothetical protein
VRNSGKLKEKLFTKIHALFFVHGEDINMVKGHNVGFIVNLKPLTIHHKLIAFPSIMVTAPLESAECTT